MSGADEHEADALEAFVRALHSRDESACRLHAPQARARLVRFCDGYLGDEDAAEDAAQEVLARIVLANELPHSPRAWLLRVARNHCLDRLRSRATRPEAASLATSFDLAHDTRGPISRIVGSEREDEVARALGELSAAEREIVRLRYVDGLARAEIAELIGVSEDAVKSRLYEAVERLRRRLRVDNESTRGP